MSTLHNLLAPIARTAITWLSRKRLPQVDGTKTLAGLSAPVEIYRDGWGIPHIYAQTTQDVFFAQGFVHAQDRLWQMEMNRRTAQGRLSELFGELALDTDRTTRTFGFHRLAASDWGNFKPELKEIFSAYAAGVNAFIDDPASKLPVEFLLLNHKPEPWQPEDSTSFSRVMIWQLSHAWFGEIIRAKIVEAVGAEHAAELEIQFPEDNPLTLPVGIEFNTLDAGGDLRLANSPFLDRGKGSNAWVLSRDKSATGGAVLSNDMHLAISLPSLWYEAHLNVGDEFHVTGVSLPGLPMILVGHNASIAWGMTLAFTDAEDLFIEKFDIQNPHRYHFCGEWLDAEISREVIQVKGQAEPHIEEVVITHHGPIISDVVGHPEQRIAVNSMALRPSPAFEGWWLLNKAKGWDEFVEAMRRIEAPQLNVAYADVRDNIGYWVTGKVPRRAKGDGTVPVPGWSGEYEWIGEVPFEEMPHALNPLQGYLVTCNHKIIPDDYPHFLGHVWMNGYRARRIVSVIESKAKVSLADQRDLHMDFTCLPGLEFVDRLQGYTHPDPDVQLALEKLRLWDGKLTPDSIGGIVYEVARYTLVRNLLNTGLGAELATRVMGQGFHPLLFHSHEFYGHDTVAMLRMLDNPDSWWIRRAGGREALITQSLKQTIQWLRAELGPQLSDWRWGKIHKISFDHPLGLQKPLDQVFNRGPYPIGGDTDTPCQTAMQPGDPYDNTAWSPSFRQVIDMRDFSNSVAIHPPGQSGQLASPHYDDLAQLWLDGEYHPMLWKRDEVERSASSKLILRP
jgi:penicillin amidase